MRLVLLYGLMTMAIATITAGLPFASIYLIFDGGASFLSTISKNFGILSFLFAAFVIGAMCSQVFWVFLSNMLGKSAALIAGLSAYIILLLILFYALPSTNITTMFILFLLAGVTNGAYQQIPWAMYPDLMDQTRVEFGEAIEGAFNSVWLFGQKVANAFAPGFLALILGIYGFQSSTMRKIEQPDQALTALKVMVTLVPAAFLFFAILGIISVHRRKK